MSFVGVTAQGRRIVYRDHKRYLWLFSPALLAVPFVTIGIYFWTGGAAVATLIPFVFIFGFIPLMDAILGEDFNNPPPEVVAAMDADPYYSRIAWATVPLYWSSYLAMAAFVGTQHSSGARHAQSHTKTKAVAILGWFSRVNRRRSTRQRDTGHWCRC